MNGPIHPNICYWLCCSRLAFYWQFCEGHMLANQTNKLRYSMWELIPQPCTYLLAHVRYEIICRCWTILAHWLLNLYSRRHMYSLQLKIVQYTSGPVRATRTAFQVFVRYPYMAWDEPLYTISLKYKAHSISKCSSSFGTFFTFLVYNFLNFIYQYTFDAPLLRFHE